MKETSIKTKQFCDIPTACFFTDGELPMGDIPQDAYERMENREAIEDAEGRIKSLPLTINRSEYHIVEVTMLTVSMCLVIFRFTTWSDLWKDVITTLKKNDALTHPEEVMGICFSNLPIYVKGHSIVIDERMDTPFNTIPDLGVVHVFATKRPSGWKPVAIGYNLTS